MVQKISKDIRKKKKKLLTVSKLHIYTTFSLSSPKIPYTLTYLSHFTYLER